MPAGRPSGATSTRDDLLRTAAELFAEKGYDGASIRMITDRVGVDAALVRHYFGDKEGLFTEAIFDRIDFVGLVSDALDCHPDELGRSFARCYLGLWEDPETQVVMRALLHSALDAHPVHERVQGTLFHYIQTDHPIVPNQDPTRLSLAWSHLIGMAMVRYVLRFEPLASMDVEVLADELAPIIQRLLTGE